VAGLEIVDEMLSKTPRQNVMDRMESKRRADKERFCERLVLIPFH
jgi:hypothetical protein